MGALNTALHTSDAPVRQCRIKAIFSELDGEDRQALIEALGDRVGWTGAGLARVLTDTGHQATGAQVNDHRNHRCSCASRPIVYSPICAEGVR